jgi:hypothetical protein
MITGVNSEGALEKYVDVSGFKFGTVFHGY